MADSSSPEPQDAAPPSALISRFHPHHELATVVRRPPAPGRKPLPDAVAIHLVVVPDSAPGYDGQTPAAARRRQPAASGGASNVSRAIAAVADATRGSAGRPGQGQFAGHWPSHFAQVLAETLAGSRPPGQLGPWTTQQTRRRISQLGPLLSTAHQPRVKRVIVTSPAGGVLEMTVIVGLGTRVRALAVRMERAPASPARTEERQPPAAVRRGPSGRPNLTGHPGWICTAIEAA